MMHPLCDRWISLEAGTRCAPVAGHDGPCMDAAAVQEALADWGRLQAMCDDEPAVGPLFEGRE